MTLGMILVMIQYFFIPVGKVLTYRHEFGPYSYVFTLMPLMLGLSLIAIASCLIENDTNNLQDTE